MKLGQKTRTILDSEHVSGLQGCITSNSYVCERRVALERYHRLFSLNSLYGKQGFQEQV